MLPNCQQLLFNFACHPGQRSDLLLLQVEPLQQHKAYDDIATAVQTEF